MNKGLNGVSPYWYIPSLHKVQKRRDQDKRNDGMAPSSSKRAQMFSRFYKLSFIKKNLVQ